MKLGPQIHMDIPDALGTTSMLAVSATDRGDAIASDDSKAAVIKERNCILFLSYQSLRSDKNECNLQRLKERLELATLT